MRMSPPLNSNPRTEVVSSRYSIYANVTTMYYFLDGMSGRVYKVKLIAVNKVDKLCIALESI